MAGSVKEKIERIFRMGGYHAAQDLVGMPADTFQFIVQEKPGINCNFHYLSTALQAKLKKPEGNQIHTTKALYPS